METKEVAEEMKRAFSSCFRKTLIFILFCFSSTIIFGDIIQSGCFNPIEFNMVFEGENSEKSVSAVAKSYYSRNKLGGTVTIRRINHSQAWGFVMEKGDAVDVEFNITSGGTYGLNVYCVPKNYNQLNSALPNGNVWPIEIEKYTTGSNMGDTKSFKIEVSCVSEYEGSKTYVVTKNGNEGARFTVAGGQFFIVAFLNEGGATNHDYNLGYTIRVKKTSNPTPFPPQMVFASQGDYPDKILVGWGSISEGYDSRLYKVYRSESLSGKKILIGETSESTYEDTTAVYGNWVAD